MPSDDLFADTFGDVQSRQMQQQVNSSLEFCW